MVKALVVDDDPEVLQLLLDLVSELGFDEVESATDGEEALQMFRKDQHKLVVTDLLIPKLDGIRLANTVKDESSGATAVIIITAITHSLAEDLKDSRADDSFGKPIPWRKLKKRILQLIPELAS